MADVVWSRDLTLTWRQPRPWHRKEGKWPQFVSIGRFAQLARLTPRALGLYDELGLLTPALVEPTNGYRLYRLEQVATAQMIRRLRDPGVPLEDIRVYAEAQTPASQRRDAPCWRGTGNGWNGSWRPHETGSPN